ncbi:MAG: DUF6524 family protein [Gammaproteobacteria bacterium]|nr:hypothetical protein [Gammaproteobacteria bacterium]
MAVHRFGLRSFLVRLAFSAVLVLLTFNPTRFSYIHWLQESFVNSRLGPAHALAGVVVLAGWAILLRATTRSLGLWGMLIGAAFFGTLIWFLIGMGWLTLDQRSEITWIALICLSGLLALGLSWSHVRRRLTGQVDVDDVDV